MTKREREQVVELLRCVWDQRDSEYMRVVSCRGVGELIGADAMTIHEAICARNSVSMERADLGLPRMDSYHDECLEAAARVEEGSWPGADQ